LFLDDRLDGDARAPEPGRPARKNQVITRDTCAGIKRLYTSAEPTQTGWGEKKKMARGLPARFDKHMRKQLGARAVWQPGTPITLGTVYMRDGREFKPVDHVDSFGATFMAKSFIDKSLSLTSSNVSQRIFQLGVELPSPDALDLTQKASVELSFKNAEEYFLKTPQLQGQVVDKVGQLTAKVAKHADWKHREFAIAYEVFSARDFTFLATQKKERSIKFSGEGVEILALLNSGFSGSLTKTGSVDLELIGGGPLGMNLVVAKADGSPDFI
jgi:hypothetical protein